MAYDLSNIPDLVSRKEFFSLKSNERINYKNLVDDDPKIKGKFQLRAHQLFVKNLMNPNTNYNRLHLEHMTGLGKCHGWGTKIRMYDGTVREVQDIEVGDQLMGDEPLDVQPLPRNVLSLARGIDTMVRIVPLYPPCSITGFQRHMVDDAFTCNMPHMLTLTNGIDTIDVPVEEYLKHQRTHYATYKLFKPTYVGCRPQMFDFKVQMLGVDDYYGFMLTGNGRYLLESGMVTHNTSCGIAVANEFIRAYKFLYDKSHELIKDYATLQATTPTVFILGFGGAKQAFMGELLSRPFFGYISEAELEELQILRRNKADGNPRRIEEYKKKLRSLKKRIQSKKLGGFFKFYGYDEFVNRLFYGKITLSDIEKEAMHRYRTTGNDNFDIIGEKIAAGELYVNEALLLQMKHSLIIADEVHETYNTFMKNNRGLAIQYCLDTIPTLKFLSLSATPMSNSPTEIIDLLNYLQPHKLRKSEFFVDSLHISEEKLNELGKISAGKFSYVRDSNITYYPTRVMHGVTLSAQGNEVPYLKFIECPMSELHQKTYFDYVAEYIANREARIAEGMNDTSPEDIEEEEAKGYIPIPVSGYSIMDMIFPGKHGVVWKSTDKSDIMGDFKNNAFHVTTITGDFLERVELEKYSSKYSMLLTTLHNIIASCGGDPMRAGKCLIYHNNVEMSGVIIIQELLLKNGFINEYQSPVDSTLCCVCGRLKVEHGTVLSDAMSTACTFYPARFTCVYGGVDKNTIAKNLEIFDSDDNLHGQKIMVLLGSKIIKQSFDFKAVQHLIVTSLPTNISTLIQVFGRCIRTRSHEKLPIEQHKVNIYILLTTINTSLPHSDIISPELYRYIHKLSEYKIIQRVEQKINEYAIDGYIHRDIIMPNEYVHAPDLGALYYKPIYTVTMQHPLDTFFAYNHNVDEVTTITFIIKYLFYREPVWTYGDLWAKVRDPPVKVEVNPELFLESSFIMALYGLTKPKLTVHSMQGAKSGDLYTSNQEIYRDGKFWKIHMVGEYYILFPIVEINNVFADKVIEYVKDKESALTDKLNVPSTVVIDAESYKRVGTFGNKRISYKPWLHTYDVQYQKDLDVFKQLDSYKNILYKTSSNFQKAFVEKYIVASLNKALGTSVEDPFYDSPLAVKTGKYLSLFGMMIQYKEVAKYANIAKKIRITSEITELELQSIHIGYESTKFIRLYDGVEWININKIDMNYDINYRENDIVVGILEPVHDNILFKLRTPIQHITTKYRSYVESKQHIAATSQKKLTTMRLSAGDHRVIERGMMCETKSKSELYNIALNLEIEVSTSRKTSSVCEMVRDELIKRELEERSKRSVTKYVYFWWNSSVNIMAVV